MLRSFAIALFTAPCLLACACARGPSPPPPAGPTRPEAPVALSFRLLRGGDGEGVILSGQGAVDPRRGSRVNAVSPRGGASQDLEMTAERVDDGTVLVRVHYEERGPEGASLEWRPEVRAPRGIPARVEVAGAGWSRALELTVQ